MHTITKTMLALLASTGSLLAGPVSAIAAPGTGPTWSTDAAVDCGSAGAGQVAVNSGNSQAVTWNPFLLTSRSGLSAVLDPTALHITVTDNGSVLFSINAVKASAPGSLTCTLSGSNGSAVITGTITGNLVAT